MSYRAPGRHERLEGRSLGDVVHCAGVTGDFRTRPLDTVAAHVGAVETLLRTSDVRSIVYLSSTRVLRGAGVAHEDDALRLAPADPDHLYDLSKALGEALVLASGVPALVLRLSNVFGIDLTSRTFLASVLRDALRDGEVLLRTALDSTRNYVGVDDVVAAIMALMERGARGIHHVAGDRAVSHRELMQAVAALTGCTVRVADGAPTEVAPDIDIARVRAAIGFEPESVIDALPRLVEGYRSALSAERRG